MGLLMGAVCLLMETSGPVSKMSAVLMERSVLSIVRVWCGDKEILGIVEDGIGRSAAS